MDLSAVGTFNNALLWREVEASEQAPVDLQLLASSNGIADVVNGQWVENRRDLLSVTQRVIQETTGLSPQISTSGGTSDGRFIAPTGAEVVELGPVNDTIHKLNECVKVSDLDLLSRMYEQIITGLLAR